LYFINCLLQNDAMNKLPPHADMSSDSYYTTLEVAKILGMAVRSVQLMVDRGDLQAWKTPGGASADHPGIAGALDSGQPGRRHRRGGFARHGP
jgi:hypothetical protein